MLVEHSGAAKVLIVEDEFLVALQLEEIIADGGHAVIGTICDRASLGSVGERPDIALVDLNLRDGLTGPEIARHIAARYAARVIYVTANPGQIDLPADTAVGIVQKPFSPAAIIAAINYAMLGCPDACRPSSLESVPVVGLA